jgi:hypothetical protein
MKRALLIVSFGASACHDPPPYELSEADVRIFAENRCRASADCCNTDTDIADCSDTLTKDILDYQALTDAALTFSEGCIADVLAWSSEIDCGSATELEDPGCRLAHGDRAMGEPCITFGDLGFFGTDCSDGLQCMVGRCVDDPFLVTQRAQEGEQCDPYISCETDLFCDSQGICRLRAEPGAPCSDRNECGPNTEYYCRGFMVGEGECVPKSGLGELCDPVELACEFACNAAGECQLLECTDGMCSPRGPAVCELSS